MKKKNKSLSKGKLQKQFAEGKKIEEQKYVDEFMDIEDNDEPEYPFEEKVKPLVSEESETKNK